VKLRLLKKTGAALVVIMNLERCSRALLKIFRLNKLSLNFLKETLQS